jgi:hypothetical protein
MSEPLPIFCTLNAADLEARKDEIRALGADALIDATPAGDRAVLRFKPGAEIRARVDGIVAAESECCAFLDFRVEQDATATVLTIAAPNGGAEVAHELAAMFAGN